MASLPVVGFGEGLLFGSDGPIGVSVAPMMPQSTEVVPEVGPQERPAARFVPLSNMHEFVRQQLAAAAAVIVGPQQHEPSDRHCARTEGKQRRLHYPHPFSQLPAENIVRLDLWSL